MQVRKMHAHSFYLGIDDFGWGRADTKLNCLTNRVTLAVKQSKYKVSLSFIFASLRPFGVAFCATVAILTMLYNH